MDSCEVEDKCLRINVDDVIYDKKVEFFPWLASTNDKIINSIHLIGSVRLTHLVTFIEQMNLILLNKDIITSIFLHIRVSKPNAFKHRRLRDIFAEYSNLTSLTITSPHIIPSIQFTEDQYNKITDLAIDIDDDKWLLTLPKFKSLRDLHINDKMVEYTDQIRNNWNYIDLTDTICKKLLEMVSLSISINLYKMLLSNRLYRLQQSDRVEKLQLRGINSVDTLAAFFLKLPGLKVINLDITNNHEILPMLNNCPNLVDVKINGDSILMLFISRKQQMYPFFDTLLKNQSKRTLEYHRCCGQPVLGTESYHKLRTLIGKGLVLDKKVLNPLNYPVALKMVEHGYKLDPDCIHRVMKCENISTFKHRCKLLKHFEKPLDMDSLMIGFDQPHKDILSKIDL